MPVFNKIKLGVRSKIFTASLVIALMLLLSGALAFFELGRMSRYISDFISNSILSVDLTRTSHATCSTPPSAIIPTSSAR